MQKKVINL